jgi:2-polyprenyl-3-methyl-5-hydroxy-6-metoxy-1,4-benzoquinol methylase
MFLSERATQAEYCDRADLSLDEVRAVYRQLARIHRLLQTSDAFQRPLVQMLDEASVRRLSVLDLGAGDGTIGRSLESWAARRGWDWRVVNVDANVAALGLHGSGRNVGGDVCALPFADDSFDVVIASQMTHHLAEAEVVRHFAEAWRVARGVVCLTDAHRNVGALCFISVLMRVLGFSPEFRADAALSVRRGWRVREWRELAGRAGMVDAKVQLHFGARIVLVARKPA